MKYTQSQAMNFGYIRYLEAMAKELNDAGYKIRGRLGNNTYELEYKIDDDTPDLFIYGINDSKAMNYLKQIGLVNNGRCPICGSPIKSNTCSYTSPTDPNISFYICNECYRGSTNMQRKMGIGNNTSSNTGCMLSLFFIPWHILVNLSKSLFQ